MWEQILNGLALKRATRNAAQTALVLTNEQDHVSFTSWVLDCRDQNLLSPEQTDEIMGEWSRPKRRNSAV